MCVCVCVCVCVCMCVRACVRVCVLNSSIAVSRQVMFVDDQFYKICRLLQILVKFSNYNWLSFKFICYLEKYNLTKLFVFVFCFF